MSIFVCVFSVVAVAQKKQLVILHTNDTHSCIMPLNPNLADTALAGRGGFLRRMALIEDERAKTPGLLLIDSGDFSQGSPYYNFYKGEVEVELMNRMGYDVATIGNHEFDFGLENMARLFRNARFAVVCANYDFSGTPCEGIVKPYTVIVRNGVRIGVFGLSPRLEGLITATNYGSTKYLDPIPVAKRMVSILRGKEKCDIVICLSHLGWKIGDPTASDECVIKETTGIDLMLGGHSHTMLATPQYVEDAAGKKVPVIQNGKSACSISRFDIHVK